jgi:glycolate oxidase iron-sulfur subunit
MSASPIDPSGELRALASDCVHCGFCLPVCPTYQLWGEEMDSPRGRIHLMTQILDGAAAGGTVAGGTVAGGTVAGGTVAGEAAATHLDRCLGCMACVPACPSGVQYDRLIGAARGWAEETPGSGAPAPLPPRSLRARAARAAIFATFPYPRRLRLLTRPLRAAQRTGVIRRLDRSRLAARFAPELVASLRVAPSPPRGHRAALARRVPAQGPRRAVVGLLTGCVQQVFFPGVNEATVRVLAAEGCDVVIPRHQGCCGALSLHSGRAAEAARFARQTITEFEDAGVDVVVVNSAGCGSAMKEYTHLFPAGVPGRPSRAPGGAGPDTGGAGPDTGGAGPDTGGAGPDTGGAGPDAAHWARRAERFTRGVRDLSEFLAELAADGGPRAVRHPLPVTAVYHEACHLGHAQGIRRQPRELLGGIPGLTIVEPADPGTCCGSAGVYNLLQPEAAGELGARKAASVLATGAPLVISANPGCSLQISAAMAAAGTGTPPAMAHIAEVLDASLRGAAVTELTGRPVPARP